MHDSFDPYHQWLGILPSEQPANWYRLLGLKLWESNPEVIEKATQKQIAIAKQHQAGPHALAAQQVLTQLATARLCLLSTDKKISYDQHLREQIQGIPRPAPPRPASSLPPPLPPTANAAPVASAVPLARPIAAGQAPAANVPLARAIVPPPPPTPPPPAPPPVQASIPILEGPATNKPSAAPLDATVMLPSRASQEYDDDDYVEEVPGERYSNAGRWKTSQDMRLGPTGAAPAIVPIPMQPVGAPGFGAHGAMMPVAPPVSEEADEEPVAPRRRIGIKILGFLAIPVFLIGMLGVSVSLYYMLRPSTKPVETTVASAAATQANSTEPEKPLTEESDPITAATEADPAAMPGDPDDGESRFVPGAPPPNLPPVDAPAVADIPEAVDMVMKNGKKRSYSPNLYYEDCRQGIYYIEKCLEQRQMEKAAGHVFRTTELFEAYPSYMNDELREELADYKVIVELLKSFWNDAAEAAYRKVLVGDSVKLGNESFRLVSRSGKVLEVEHSGLTAEGPLERLPPLVVMAFYSEVSKSKGSEASLAMAAFGSFDPAVKTDAAASQAVRRAYQQASAAGTTNALLEKRLGVKGRRRGKKGDAASEMEDEPE